MLKSNTRRNTLSDAVDMLMGSNEIASIEDIAIDKLQAFNNHPFSLYEGERLDDMVESIKEYGVITPLIVRKLNNGTYEILAGHNRANASKLAGLDSVPCLIKTDLTDEEAMMYVIETNLMQRSFSDMTTSEKAIVLKEKYENAKGHGNQGKRTDIIREIAILNGETYEDNNTISTRSEVGKEYGLSGTSVARLLRVNNLIEPFKVLVDTDVIPLLAAVELSFIINQQMLYEIIIANSFKVTVPLAKELRELDRVKGLTEEDIMNVFVKPKQEKDSSKVDISNDVYLKYLKGKKKKDINQIINDAVTYYCENILKGE